MSLVLLPVGLIVELVTRRRGGLYEPAAVPLGVFTVVFVLVLLTPVQSAFSRRLEREADWVALQTTRQPAAAQRLFARFTREALAQPRPPGWAKLLEDHPSVMERIELAEAWAARHPRSRRGRSDRDQ
jgi:STE24 endopeptidase